MNTQYSRELSEQASSEERRIAARLPITRLNVLISGARLTTVDISDGGAQVHCPAAEFPLIESLLHGKVEMVIELPIGREVTTDAKVAYVRTESADVFIGFGFEDFRYQDQRGWLAFIASQEKALIPSQTLSSIR